MANTAFATEAGKAQAALESRTAELKSLKERIRAVEQAIAEAQLKTDELNAQLRETESIAEAIAGRLREIREAIERQQANLEVLRAERAQQEQALAEARAQLGRQIRAAYMQGQRDYLKLLLNQEDPALVGRVLAYYDYHNRARARDIAEVNARIKRLSATEEAIRAQTLELERLQAAEQERLAETERVRIARREIIARLNAEIRGHDAELKTLRDDEKRLERLIEDLAARLEQAKRQLPGAPPFETLRGRLRWPVPGPLLSRFGSPRRGGVLTWQGVRLAAAPGETVHAVSAGRVIFADWFRHLGLLIIIDHGSGYMSLYGHNQHLLKAQGDWVKSGEAIAQAGDTGDQERPAVYFEIRRDGKPVNPDEWCKG